MGKKKKEPKNADLQQHKQKKENQTHQQKRKHYLEMKQNETFPRAILSLTGGEEKGN